MAWYEAENVSVIPKYMNPPNCPQLHPIELYWAIVKRKLMNSGACANDTVSMLENWSLHAEKLSNKLVQNLKGRINRQTHFFLRSKEL